MAQQGRILCLVLLLALQQHLGPVEASTSAAAGVWGSRPTGALRHRLLLDAVPGPAPAEQGAARPPPSPAPSASGTIIETLVDQKCSMMHHALITGQVLVRGSINQQPGGVQCCASCLNTEGCTAWVYCPVEGGCSAEQSNITIVANTTAGAPDETEQRRQLELPHRGCRLLSIPAFTLQQDSPQILAAGPDVQFVTGTPVSIELPMFPGYSLKPGMDTVVGLGYRCTESLLLYSCLLKGDAQELAGMCNKDPLCKAFVYLPNGIDSLSEPIGIFKGGDDVHSIDTSQLASNSATALYIKDSVLTTTGRPQVRSTGDSNHAVLWIVLPTVLATALLAVAVVAGYALLKMRQQARQHAAEVTAAAAVAAASRQKPKRASKANASVMAAPGGAAGTAGAAGGGLAAPAGGFASLSVHLVPKPSPPHSGSSGGSDGSDGSSPHSGSRPKSSPPHSGTSGTSCVTTAGVQCPQCGAALGIRCRTDWLPPQMRQMITSVPAHPQQQPQVFQQPQVLQQQEAPAQQQQQALVTPPQPYPQPYVQPQQPQQQQQVGAPAPPQHVPAPAADNAGGGGFSAA